MNFKEDLVYLSSIDLEDHAFRITTNKSLKSLTLSIKNVGLLNPPILVKKNSDFRVISGFRRIYASFDLGMTRIPARIVESHQNKHACVMIAIADNSLQRTLNLIEQSRALGMLKEFYPDNKQLVKAASVLCLPDHPAMIDKVKNICHLEPDIQNGILSNRISLSMALELEKLKNDEGSLFAVLVEKLNLSLNKQREILNYIKEISMIENISITNLLTKGQLYEIIEDQELDKNKKTHLIRSLLKQRRFPQISRTQKKLTEKISKLKLETNLNLIPPKDFEKRIFSLNLQFENMEQLHKNKRAFDKFIKNQIVKDILV
jgi:ParB family chromosome partitioning protein